MSFVTSFGRLFPSYIYMGGERTEYLHFETHTRNCAHRNCTFMHVPGIDVCQYTCIDNYGDAAPSVVQMRMKVRSGQENQCGKKKKKKKKKWEDLFDNGEYRMCVCVCTYVHTVDADSTRAFQSSLRIIPRRNSVHDPHAHTYK